MPKKILLADDSITIQKVVELTFSDGDYEVIATSNGTKAVEQIPKVKPDIILSDIIMPEKNGYEVCEWVKSHPEFRSTPVILLTGTFEPFDPDRAEKAGCDAVVTKPFESQSLIQKVEELISRRSSVEQEPVATEQHPILESAPESEPEPTPEAPSWEPEPAEAASDEQFAPPPAPSFELGEPTADDSSPFEGAESSSVPPPPQFDVPPFPAEQEQPKPQGDVFASEVPGNEDSFDDSATRIIPKMSMEEMQRLQQQGSASEPSYQSEPEPEPPAFEPPSTPPSLSSQDREESPFGGETSIASEDESTRMIPKISMEDIERIRREQQEEQSEPQAAAPPVEDTPFGDAAPPQAGSPFEEEQQPFAPSEPEAPAWSSESAPEAPAWESAPAEEIDAEDSTTRLIPKMAFEDIQRMQQEQESAEESFGSSEPETPEAIETPGFAMGAPGAPEEAASPNPFESQEPEPVEEPASEEPAPFMESAPEPIPAPPLPPEEPVAEEPRTEEPIEEQPMAAAFSGDLSEDQIERIARRVVELLSDKAIRDIAWEVIPETAEMIVRERIRELEAEEA